MTFRALGPALAVLALAAAGPAAAEAPAAPGAFPGEQPDTWQQPPTRAQAERDPVLLPPGKGALFVPSMTDPSREPTVLVEGADGLVATRLMGQTIVLEPGVYTVRLGSGALTDRFARRVRVREGRTTLVPATWASLVVNVVDERSVPFRGSYELIRLPDRTNLGLGLGADIELGEEVRTWVLRPGTYLLIKTGESYRARRDYFTIRLQPGELYEMSLVLDPETGGFLGAGQALTTGRDTAVRDWRLNLVLGGDVELNHRNDVVGFRSGTGFTVGGFVDFVARYRPERHFLYARARLEEKQVKLPGDPFTKDLDEVRLDALYVWRLLPWLGPYVRGSLQSTVFSGFEEFDGPTEVVRVDGAGAVQAVLGTFSERFELSRPFAPVDLRGGVGLSALTTASYVLDANIRLGLGGRALLTRGAYTPVGTSAAGQLEVSRRDDAYQYGLELTVVGSARLSRWVLATTELELLEPFGDLRNPVVDWETTVGLRLVSFASLNYIFKLLRDSERSESLQTEHRLLLRFTWRLL